MSYRRPNQRAYHVPQQANPPGAAGYPPRVPGYGRGYPAQQVAPPHVFPQQQGRANPLPAYPAVQVPPLQQGLGYTQPGYAPQQAYAPQQVYGQNPFGSQDPGYPHGYAGQPGATYPQQQLDTYGQPGYPQQDYFYQDESQAFQSTTTEADMWAGGGQTFVDQEVTVDNGAYGGGFDGDTGYNGGFSADDGSNYY